MPSHFGRFRLLNDTPPDANGRTVTSATLKIGTPQVPHPVVAPTSPVGPKQDAQLDLAEGTATADTVLLSMTIKDAAGGTCQITDWQVPLAAAGPLRSVDVTIALQAAGGYSACATVTDWNGLIQNAKELFV